MGIFASLDTRQRILFWVTSGVLAGSALANWIHLNTVISYEEKNEVECRNGSTSNTTMREYNKFLFGISFLLFLIASYYLFFSARKSAEISTALGQKRSLYSVVSE